MINILKTMEAELDECVALLRRHYPDDDDDALRDRAMCMRQKRYAVGRWPTDEEIEEEIAAKKAKEAAEKKAREAWEKEAAETAA